jgi:hypothetical protein
MLLATSDDMGETWSPARPLVDRQPGRREYGVVTAEGIHVHDGVMAAYYGYYDRTREGVLMYYATGGNIAMARADRPHLAGTHCGIMRSDDGGATWTGPVATIDRFCPNLRPQPIAGGRLIMPGHLWYPWTDDPEGIRGWTHAALPGLPEDYRDDPEGFHRGAVRRGDARPLCEGSFFQTDDGVVHMMLRTGGPLAVAESRDRGVTWSQPMQTDFSDCGSRCHFGHLPDGRAFAVSCPAPASPRTPLVLAASEDGVVFDRHYVLGAEANHLAREPGVHKYGRYGYPSYHVAGETMLVIYTICKEDVAVCRFALSELG